MNDTLTTLANLLVRLLDAVDEDPRAAADRESAWEEFRAGREPDGAMRSRFEEWYLFERRSPLLGDAPAFVALSERFDDDVPPDERDLLDEMAATAFGAFEIEGVETDRVELRDLLSGRRFDVEGALPSDVLPRSIVVGRLFPTGRGTYLRSPSTVLASSELSEALRADLARQAEEDRGRLSQRQMEDVLFPVVGAVGFEPLERLEAEVEKWLRHGSVQDLDLPDVRARFLAAESLSEAVGDLLDEAAFTSDADLEEGRRVLPAYYAALRVRAEAAPPEPAEPETETASRTDELRARAGEICACGSGRVYGDCCLPRDAVARFESGRTRGESLDALIAGLEAAMGVHIDDDEEDAPLTATAPPFRPLVEEFLWERDSLGQPVPDAQRQTLQEFARSLEDGAGAPETAEDLAAPHFQRFLAFERYSMPAAPAAGQIESDVDALEAFANWMRDEQGVDSAAVLEPIASRIREDSARLASANALLGARVAGSGERAFVVLGASRAANGELEVEPLDARGSRVRASIDVRAAAFVRAGDCTVGSADRIVRVLPSEARDFLVPLAKRRDD